MCQKSRSQGREFPHFFPFWIYPLNEGKPVSQVKGVVTSHFSPRSSQRTLRSGKNPTKSDQALGRSQMRLRGENTATLQHSKQVTLIFFVSFEVCSGVPPRFIARLLITLQSFESTAAKQILWEILQSKRATASASFGGGKQRRYAPPEWWKTGGCRPFWRQSTNKVWRWDWAPPE